MSTSHCTGKPAPEHLREAKALLDELAAPAA